MSHEIRTPLNGVLGMLQLMRGLQNESERDEYVDIALSSGRALLAILDDVLNLSRIEAGAVNLENTPFSLAEVVLSSTRVFEPEIMGRDLKIISKVDPSIHDPLIGDQSRVRQVLFNLVGNSIKFTERGTIRVEAVALPIQPSEYGLRVLFTVADTGIGIPDERMDDIFDMFTQVDGSFTRRYQGSGLGLGIVRRLVEMMNGTLCMESKEGKGTTLYFTLQFTYNEETAQEVHNECVHSMEPLHVLVAEDDHINRIAIERFLERLGHSCVCVVNGQEAVLAATKGSFDVVLMDVQMPVMDGLAAAKAIRQLPETAGEIPIIALTAYSMKGDRERFIELGMDAYLKKPVAMPELAATLALATTNKPPIKG